MARSTEDYETSDSEVDRGEAAFMGNLKTTLRWDTGSKQLCLGVKQTAESMRGLEAKYKGLLNTASGTFTYSGYLRKGFATNKPSLSKLMEAEAEDKGKDGKGAGRGLGRSWLPGGWQPLLFRDWLIAPGVAIAGSAGGAGSSAATGGFTYHLGLRKPPQVLKRFASLDSWVSAKAAAEYDPRTQAVATSASLRLKLYKYNVTDKQDVKVVLGVDVESSGAKDGKLKRSPYFKIEENAWGLRLEKGAWQCVYQL